MTTFRSRADLGLRRPRSISKNITPQNGGVAGHYAGPALRITSHSQCENYWRSWQNYHMDRHGWTDIAYTLGVCDHDYVFAGRGAGVRTAANGTNYGNQNFYAICWVGGQGETPSPGAIRAFWWAVNLLRKQGGAGSAVKEHKDFKSTACPGNLGSVIDAGPSNTDTQGEIMLKRGDQGNAVAVFQKALKKWKAEALPKFGADADFGGETEEWVKKYQGAANLPKTGQIDGVTASLLTRYVSMVSGGGGSGDYAAASHTHGYVDKSTYSDHTHGTGKPK